MIPVGHILGALAVIATMTIWLEPPYASLVVQAAVLLLAAVVIAKQPISIPLRWSLLLAAVAAWGPAQLLAGSTEYRYATAASTLQWVSRAVVFVLACQALRLRDPRHHARTVLAAFGASIAVFAIAQAYTSHGKYFWLFPSGQPEVFGPFQNRNNYAAFIELLLPLALWRSFTAGPRRMLWLIVSAIMAASVAASASRAGSVLVAAELLAVPSISWWQKRMPPGELLLLTSILALVSASAVAITGWSTLLSRLFDSDPFLYRREILHSALAMVRERPWAGFGLGTFTTAYPAYATFDSGYFVNFAHNDWAEWAVEGGVAFLLLLLAIAIPVGLAALRSGWGLGVPAVFLHGLVDFPMQRPGVSFWLLIVAAAVMVDQQDRVARQRRKPAAYPQSGECHAPADS